MKAAAARAWRRVALAAALALAPAARAQDELGLGKMWTFERPPLAYLQREYGIAPDEAWWNRMRLASLRFGRGCSASFVSPQGLILTNHHCVRDFVAKVQGEHDWVRDGFVAAELEHEVRLPGLTVQQLVRMTDVTARVRDGVSDDAPAGAGEKQRAKNRERIVADARAADPGLEPRLVKLFQGAIWQLYQDRVFDDVRRVMAPHLQVSHFGGDPDNFVYPRYAIDFAFCRAYVEGKPADTREHHFEWGDGPKAGELVFVTGNPGGSNRLLTKAQLEFQRDARYPRIREMIDARLQIMRAEASKSAAAEKKWRTSILSYENGQKLYRGEHKALLDPAFMARKEEAESSFRQRAEQAGHAPYLRVWDDIAALMAAKNENEAPFNFHSAGGLPLLMRAEELLEFAADGDPAKAKWARDIRCDPDAVQQALFADHLARARRWLPADDPYLALMLAGREPEAAAAHLLAKSSLCDNSVVEQLIAGGKATIEASSDPALVLARSLRDVVGETTRRQEAIDAAETALGTRLAKLLFAVYGDEVSPDATFTLRWSDGRVAGYPYNGTLAPWRTVFHGLFAREAEFAGEHPFDLPDEWLLAKDRIDMRAPVDFVCTVDSTGGNSGSPIVNARLELAGVLFDGNIESLANEFLYGERVERSICVHPQAIVEALRKVYAAKRLLREIAR